MTTTFHNIPEDIRGAENFFEEYKDAMGSNLTDEQRVKLQKALAFFDKHKDERDSLDTDTRKKLFETFNQTQDEEDIIIPSEKKIDRSGQEETTREVADKNLDIPIHLTKRDQMCKHIMLQHNVHDIKFYNSYYDSDYYSFFYGYVDGSPVFFDAKTGDMLATMTNGGVIKEVGPRGYVTYKRRDPKTNTRLRSVFDLKTKRYILDSCDTSIIEILDDVHRIITTLSRSSGRSTPDDNITLYDMHGKLLITLPGLEISGYGCTLIDNQYRLPVRDIKTGKYGYIDQDGNQVIPCIYDDYSNFWGTIDTKLGILSNKEINYTQVKKDGKKLCIDANGKIIQAAKEVRKGWSTIGDNQLWGYNKTKTTTEIIQGEKKQTQEITEAVLPFAYEKSHSLRGTSVTAFWSKKEGLVLLDTEKRKIVYSDENIQDLGYTSFRGVAKIKRDNKRGYIDISSGRVVIPCIYDNARDLMWEGYPILLVEQQGKRSLVQFPTGEQIYSFTVANEKRIGLNGSTIVIGKNDKYLMDGTKVL